MNARGGGVLETVKCSPVQKLSPAGFMPGTHRGQYLYAGAGLSEIGALPTYAEARHLASNKDDLRQRASNDVKFRDILFVVSSRALLSYRILIMAIDKNIHIAIAGAGKLSDNIERCCS